MLPSDCHRLLVSSAQCCLAHIIYFTALSYASLAKSLEIWRRNRGTTPDVSLLISYLNLVSHVLRTMIHNLIPAGEAEAL